MTLKLGTRGSALAMAQSRMVAEQLTAATGEPVDLVDQPLLVAGGHQLAGVLQALALQHRLIGGQFLIAAQAGARLRSQPLGIFGQRKLAGRQYARVRPPGADGGLADRRDDIALQRDRAGQPGDGAVGPFPRHLQHRRPHRR